VSERARKENKKKNVKQKDKYFIRESWSEESGKMEQENKMERF
jgi:hypothetical protein